MTRAGVLRQEQYPEPGVGQCRGPRLFPRFKRPGSSQPPLACRKAVPTCFFLAGTSQSLHLTKASLQRCMQSLKQLHRLRTAHHVNNFSPTDQNSLEKHAAEACSLTKSISSPEHMRRGTANSSSTQARVGWRDGEREASPSSSR